MEVSVEDRVIDYFILTLVRAGCRVEMVDTLNQQPHIKFLPVFAMPKCEMQLAIGDGNIRVWGLGKKRNIPLADPNSLELAMEFIRAELEHSKSRGQY